ncbi:hypothetical protein PENTCL1PPCAC_24493 [Pristionchus entomophagus]|uniref:Uncharacterized protein n=1 Tax=Pristionchus entomophagus TaxID=358040 RepID=A0AAV5U862_9BILA|nr:hypothetical protein PENTCL1PPCAC_24493 [Pristionchus entomophagus]
MTRLLLTVLSIGLLHTAVSASVAVARPVDFKPHCNVVPSGGCECKIMDGHQERNQFYQDLDSCKVEHSVQTAENKKKLNAEIAQKYGAFKDNCFPRPSGGCKCNVDEGQGEIVKEFSLDADCKKSITKQTEENKQKLNQEIADKFGGFKQNCFPKPAGGCKCNEKDAQGNDVVSTYDDAAKCQMYPNIHNERICIQNVRDPVREKAQANYALVVQELKQKFKGLKEGCYPRPKGCMCTVGRTPEGHDITERRMKEEDCKCKEGDTGKDCPAA